MLRIQRYAVYRANLLALRLIKVSHALGTSYRIDDIYELTLVDSFVRALGFANIAIDTFIGDYESHSDNIHF